jgi:hypothetical protein
MADVIVFKTPEKAEAAVVPKTYNVEVTCYPDNLMFTINDIQVNSWSLQKVADELEKIAQIIRTDLITRVI